VKNTHRHYTLDCFHSLIGLSYSAFDCYELVQLFYKKVFCIELDTLYQVKPSSTEAKNLVKSNLENFNKVTKPQFGDIIILKILGLPVHVGIYIDNERFLHTREKTGSVLERTNNWKKRILGYYRWPEIQELD